MRVVLLSSLPPEQTRIADFAARWRAAANAAGIDVLTPMQGQKPIHSLAEARRWVDERDWSKVDVVHAQLAKGRRSEFFILRALAGIKDGPALSATVHEPDRLLWGPHHRAWALIEGLPGPLRALFVALSEPHSWWVERRLARKLDGLVAMTETGAQGLSRRLGVHRDRIQVVPHGAAHIAAAPLPVGGPVRLLHFGFLRKGKGIELLIDALGKAVAEEPALAQQLRLTMAGGTSTDPTYGQPGGYLDKLRQRITAKRVQDLVEWDLDVDGRDIPALIQRHHALVLPRGAWRPAIWLGRRRSSSGALPWATACGRGVIAPKVRTYEEDVQGGLGEAYPSGDAAALAQCLKQLAAEPARAQAWAQAASDCAARRDWSAVGQLLRQHFEAVLARRGRTPRNSSKP